MPPFPERDSSILAKLKKKKPTAVPDGAENNKEKEPRSIPAAQINTSSDAGSSKPAPVS